MARAETPTVHQLWVFLVRDNDWTEQEFADFKVAQDSLIDGDNTLATWNTWEDLATSFDG